MAAIENPETNIKMVGSKKAAEANLAAVPGLGSMAWSTTDSGTTANEVT